MTEKMHYVRKFEWTWQKKQIWEQKAGRRAVFGTYTHDKSQQRS